MLKILKVIKNYFRKIEDNTVDNSVKVIKNYFRKIEDNMVDNSVKRNFVKKFNAKKDWW